MDVNKLENVLQSDCTDIQFKLNVFKTVRSMTLQESEIAWNNQPEKGAFVIAGPTPGLEHNFNDDLGYLVQIRNAGNYYQHAKYFIRNYLGELIVFEKTPLYLMTLEQCLLVKPFFNHLKAENYSDPITIDGLEPKFGFLHQLQEVNNHAQKQKCTRR